MVIMGRRWTSIPKCGSIGNQWLQEEEKSFFFSGVATDKLPSAIVNNLLHRPIQAVLIKLSEHVKNNSNDNNMKVGGGLVGKEGWEEDKR